MAQPGPRSTRSHSVLFSEATSFGSVVDQRFQLHNLCVQTIEALIPTHKFTYAYTYKTTGKFFLNTSRNIFGLTSLRYSFLTRGTFPLGQIMGEDFPSRGTRYEKEVTS